VYPNDLYFEIAALRGQDMHNQAAHERVLREAARGEPRKPSDPPGHRGYRRLAITILGLDVNYLSDALRSRQQQQRTAGATPVPAHNAAGGS
jgi:hypothetical protein